METLKFEKLIQEITGCDFIINTTDKDIQPEKEYKIKRQLPITGRTISFYWKSAKTSEKMLKSFITAYCNKYKEPNPARYNGRYYGSKKWEDMSEQQKEYAYSHHVSNMYNKKDLLEQVQNNFNKPGITETLCKYGFYSTEYGIGIFALWATDGVMEAINKMSKYLKSKNIPYTNEFSDAKWVLRFKLGLDKQTHTNILNSF